MLHVCLIQWHVVSNFIEWLFNGMRAWCVGLQSFHGSVASFVLIFWCLLQVILDHHWRTMCLVSVSHFSQIYLLLLGKHLFFMSFGLLIVDGVLERFRAFVEVVEVNRIRMQVAQRILRRYWWLPSLFLSSWRHRLLLRRWLRVKGIRPGVQVRRRTCHEVVAG